MARINVRNPIQVTLLVAVFPFLLLADLLAAQTIVSGGSDSEPVDLIALRLEGGAGIDVDGRLDEEAWARAIPITDFTQQEPVEGGTPSERTEIRVVYDEDALYIGAILYDDPEGILAFQKRRDGFLSTSPTSAGGSDCSRESRSRSTTPPDWAARPVDTSLGSST